MVTAYLLRGKRHYDSAELENLSDHSLEDIGLEVRKRDFGGRIRQGAEFLRGGAQWTSERTTRGSRSCTPCS
jgi:hypothetical protein